MTNGDIKCKYLKEQENNQRTIPFCLVQLSVPLVLAPIFNPLFSSPACFACVANLQSRELIAREVPRKAGNSSMVMMCYEGSSPSEWKTNSLSNTSTLGLR